MNYCKKFEGENEVCADKFCNPTTRQGYFRITAYNKEEDFSCILESNGMFEKLWQFSSYLVNKGFNIIDASKLENIIDTNIEPANEDTDHIILRATQDGKVELKNNTIQVADKYYTISK